MTFRDRCRPIIARVLAEPHASQADLSAALQRAYPAEERHTKQARIWLQEIRAQMAHRAIAGEQAEMFK